MWLLVVYPQRPGGGATRQVRVTLEPGLEVGELAERLAAEGVLEHPTAWAAFMRLRGVDRRLRRGEVVVSADLSPAQLGHRVARGLGPQRARVTIPEGYTRFQIARRLDELDVCPEAAFLAATAAPLEVVGAPTPSHEGYLFPDTYELRTESDAAAVAAVLVANHRRRVRRVIAAHRAGLDRLRAELGWGLREVVVMASIVEEEAAVADERPVIAGVFLNRLRSDTFLPRHRLQADPTVSYGCIAEPDRAASCAGFDGRRITRAMLDDRDNRYNTYRRAGLPPGPISNPGLSSIVAVLAADAHDYLYFVVRGGGRHEFSATLDEHNRAVARYRERRGP